MRNCGYLFQIFKVDKIKILKTISKVILLLPLKCDKFLNLDFFRSKIARKIIFYRRKYRIYKNFQERGTLKLFGDLLISRQRNNYGYHQNDQLFESWEQRE